MNQQQWQQIEEIIDEALDLPKDKRAAYFKRMPNDPFKKEAKSLIRNIKKAEKEGFLEK